MLSVLSLSASLMILALYSNHFPAPEEIIQLSKSFCLVFCKCFIKQKSFIVKLLLNVQVNKVLTTLDFGKYNGLLENRYKYNIFSYLFIKQQKYNFVNTLIILILQPQPLCQQIYEQRNVSNDFFERFFPCLLPVFFQFKRNSNYVFQAT